MDPAPIATRPPRGERPARPTRAARARRTLVRVELLTGGSALVCGALLAARPDGSLLGLPSYVLVDSPFRDWRLPGLLLSGLVGGGYLLAGTAALVRCRGSRELSVLAGAGLVAFEVVEWRWLGFNPLQAVFMAVGAAVVVQAVVADRPARGSAAGPACGTTSPAQPVMTPRP